MALRMTSTVTGDGWVELALEEFEVPAPGSTEVVIAPEAAPINPSDLGVMFGPADLTRLEVTGEGVARRARAPIPEALRELVASRVGVSVPVGNEGAGTVVAAGEDPAAAALVGRTVATWGGAMYAQRRVARVEDCLVLPEGVTAEQAADCFVNPLTVLGFLDTMRREGHRAIVHTAAASNLGRMLIRACAADGVPLVNIVRRQEHVADLRSLGAEHVVDSSAPGFLDDLTDAVAATGATLAFDAVGGGRLASDILTAMERALVRSGAATGRYGSTVHKQVYIYGGLDRRPTELTRTWGAAWGVGGWLLPNHLARIGPEAARAMRERVAAEITTTFAATYQRTLSLSEALSAEAIAAYARMATGAKHLINPQLPV